GNDQRRWLLLRLGGRTMMDFQARAQDELKEAREHLTKAISAMVAAWSDLTGEAWTKGTQSAERRHKELNAMIAASSEGFWRPFREAMKRFEDTHPLPGGAGQQIAELLDGFATEDS